MWPGSDDKLIFIHERKAGSAATAFGSSDAPDVENWKTIYTLRGHTADVVSIKSVLVIGQQQHVEGIECGSQVVQYRDRGNVQKV
jgi:hypothetical protein